MDILDRISNIERGLVAEVLDCQFRTSAVGMMTRQLEEKFMEVFGTKFAISFINGTATMHAALAAAEIGEGDEVIVPPLTMASTSYAVLHAGALPIFADIDDLTWNIDPKSIEARIGPNTKAIIPVSLYGLAPDFDAIMKLADRYDLFVIEDDAQCLGGFYKGKIVGNFGHAASFSFQSTKHLTCGEGGMVITNNEKLANKCRRYANLGYADICADASKAKVNKKVLHDPAYNRHDSMGWNYRMPDLCAAVALGQLERINELLALRIKTATLYGEALNSCKWLTPQCTPEGCVHSYWSFVVKLSGEDGPNWHEFRNKFLELGGDCIYAAWKLTYQEPFFQSKLSELYKNEIKPPRCPAAEKIQPNLLQFKTNYFELSHAEKQAEVMRNTISHFDG